MKRELSLISNVSNNRVFLLVSLSAAGLLCLAGGKNTLVLHGLEFMITFRIQEKWQERTLRCSFE